MAGDSTAFLKIQAVSLTRNHSGAHNMLLRGESRRQLEFPDMFSLCLPDEGPTPCRPMILILDNGNSKTNQVHRGDAASGSPAMYDGPSALVGGGGAEATASVLGLAAVKGIDRLS